MSKTYLVIPLDIVGTSEAAYYRFSDSYVRASNEEEAVEKAAAKLGYNRVLFAVDPYSQPKFNVILTKTTEVRPIT